MIGRKVSSYPFLAFGPATTSINHVAAAIEVKQRSSCVCEPLTTSVCQLWRLQTKARKCLMGNAGITWEPLDA